MTRTLSFPTLWLCAMLAQGQQGTVAPLEPEYRDQYTVLTDGRLLPVERETAIVETQSKTHFVITPSVSSFQTIRGASSPVRVTPAAHFFVKLAIADQDPATVIHLRKLVAGKDDRRIPYMTIRGSLVPFSGMKHERPPDDSIPFTVQKYGAGSLEIIPNVPLAPGEYAFVNANQAQCFGVDVGGAAQASGGSEKTQPAHTTKTANTPATVWRLQPPDTSNPNGETRTAVLAGTVEAQGRQYPAQLSMGCNVFHYSNSTSMVGNLQIQLVLPRPMSARLTGDFSCEGDGASGSPSVYTEIGSTHIAARNACFDDNGMQTGTASPTIAVGLIYEPTLVKSLMDAPGEPFVVHIRTESAKPDKLVARFSLPQQNSVTQGILTPCIDLMTAARQKELASIVVACPALDGATLSEVDVVTGPRKKPMAADPENDIGTVWNLRPATKTRQVQPSRLLICGYQNAGGAIPEKKILLIPTTALTCIHRTDDYTNEPYGNCTR